MKRALLVVRNKESGAELRRSLAQPDLACSLASYNNGVREAIAGARPDVLLFEADPQQPGVPEIIRKIKQGENLPVIALVPPELVEKADFNIDADDFIAGPYDARELVLRINRIIRQKESDEGSEQIKCNGLTIDLATCEVTLEGSIVELTFKEYELLKLMASHRGRVFTREALLDKIWGYDYYGGDRTVDVHVRRLRSKIEDTSHTYIETVRNIGYRFVRNE
jgi:two-component system alkaline phosphatase synthesis response regulator PhoP